ncbi:hypothetical protein NLX86_15975 [Streptomyces sp. A3M-1-3]|uniref:hypothetical protein n=1 Tax=Streptomyces sp. A3M-1-3 TaxID=2962044 RepID=UPI0020B6B86F|nr:hypothetical protein [Streptomyces sp. A3M-1-3]MCP3819545.1 hypothetical protein [Streptomyces sp. A3M-1-3]
METSGSSTVTATHRPTQEAGAMPDVLDISHGGAEPCDLVTVPARQGLEAVDILRRGTDPAAVGPVLHDGTCDTLGFLVPPGTADAWDLPGSACTQTSGRGLRLDVGGATGAPETPLAPAPLVAGTGWLLPPGSADPVTDPAVLRAALGEAARLIEAADSCR